MSWLRAFVFGLTLLLAAPALGQAPGPRSRIDEISSLRLDLERLSEGRRQVLAQRDALAGRLEALARDIERRKSSGAGERLLPDFQLLADLRSSQELSEAVSALNREIGQLERTYRERLERLGALYDEAVAGTVGALRAAGADERADLTRVLARLRSERETLRQELAPDREPAGAGGPESGVNLLASDDPEELGERADAVRDDQDKLRRQLASLDGRIASLERELRLEREMRDFLSDQDLFNEGSRVLRVPRGAEAGKTDFTNDGRTDDALPAEGDVDGAYEGGGDPSPGAGGWGGGEGQTAMPDQPGGEGRLPVGVEQGAAATPGGDRQRGLPALRLQRDALIEQLKRLQVLHDRLREKAEELTQE
ncbi:MAG TPA: hypothetical protein PK668_00910 [Myxococcota bacterium]|nr:hypothetical protein [Myxococcota bacterium]HRY95609.1 hypothetical protein [Myxococcota bacterium]HSA20135.1 hypothetical protein [Myxococcota bacterium]